MQQFVRKVDAKLYVGCVQLQWVKASTKVPIEIEFSLSAQVEHKDFGDF